MNQKQIDLIAYVVEALEEIQALGPWKKLFLAVYREELKRTGNKEEAKKWAFKAVKWVVETGETMRVKKISHADKQRILRLFVRSCKVADHFRKAKTADEQLVMVFLANHASVMHATLKNLGIVSAEEVKKFIKRRKKWAKY